MGGQANGGSKFMSELADRQARRLAEGQTMRLALHIEGVQTPPLPPLRAPLLGYPWLVKVLLSAHLIILIGVLFTGQTIMYF